MTAESVKVVFDTNILVSGHFWKGPSYRCMLAVDAGLATLVLSDSILIEFTEKLTVKFGVSNEEILRDFPYLEADDIKAALAYAARQADHAVLQQS